MSQVTVTIVLTFEDTLTPSEADDVAAEFEDKLNVLFDEGFLDEHGTLYDFTVEHDYHANDT